jgi:hypothetical protein
MKPDWAKYLKLFSFRGHTKLFGVFGYKLEFVDKIVVI